MQVKDKRAELVNLKTTFVRRASEYLTIYFDSLVAIMEDKNYFSQVFSVQVLKGVMNFEEPRNSNHNSLFLL